MSYTAKGYHLWIISDGHLIWNMNNTVTVSWLLVDIVLCKLVVCEGINYWIGQLRGYMTYLQNAKKPCSTHWIIHYEDGSCTPLKASSHKVMWGFPEIWLANSFPSLTTDLQSTISMISDTVLCFAGPLSVKESLNIELANQILGNLIAAHF